MSFEGTSAFFTRGFIIKNGDIVIDGYKHWYQYLFDFFGDLLVKIVSLWLLPVLPFLGIAHLLIYLDLKVYASIIVAFIVFWSGFIWTFLIMFNIMYMCYSHKFLIKVQMLLESPTMFWCKRRRMEIKLVRNKFVLIDCRYYYTTKIYFYGECKKENREMIKYSKSKYFLIKYNKPVTGKIVFKWRGSKEKSVEVI